jgi:hypothetical protein
MGSNPISKLGVGENNGYELFIETASTFTAKQQAEPSVTKKLKK